MFLAETTVLQQQISENDICWSTDSVVEVDVISNNSKIKQDQIIKQQDILLKYDQIYS